MFRKEYLREVLNYWNGAIQGSWEFEPFIWPTSFCISMVCFWVTSCIAFLGEKKTFQDVDCNTENDETALCQKQKEKIMFVGGKKIVHEENIEKKRVFVICQSYYYFFFGQFALEWSQIDLN